MANDVEAGCGADGDAFLDDEARRLIDALMAEPPKGLPAIIVIGDDAVFGITPPKRPD